MFSIPNLLTLANLLSGSLAAVAALVFEDLTAAFALIVAAAVFDFADGFAARLLRCPSPLGLQLDSLADDISFGFAPSAVLFVLYGRMPGLWLGDAAGLGVFVLAAFSALRLARFNIDETQRDGFRGLPTPASALFCISLGLLAEQRGLVLPREAILATACVLSVLLVAPMRMFALKFHGFGWRGNEVRYAFLAASLVLVVLVGSYALAAIVLLYIVLSASLALAGAVGRGRKEG